MKSTRWFAALLLAALSVQPIAARAEEEEPGEADGLRQITQEFFLTEAEYLQERKEIQFTVGTILSRPYRGTRFLNADMALEYGLTDRLQVEVFSTPFGPAPGSDTLGGFGTRYGLFNTPRSALSAALEVELVDDEGDRRMAVEPSLVYAQQVGRGQVHIGASAELGRGAVPFALSATGVYPVGRLAAVLEAIWFAGSERGAAVVPGLYYRLGVGKEIGFGFPLIRSRESTDARVIGKFILEF